MKLSRDNGTSATLARDLEPPAASASVPWDDLKSYAALRARPSSMRMITTVPSSSAETPPPTRLAASFIPNIEADRPDAGTTARTQGAYTSSLRARVLPTS